MAKVYLITEEEMLSLLESLELHKLREQGHMRGAKPEDDQIRSDMHRSFHFVAVRWAQSVGFKGYRS